MSYTLPANYDSIFNPPDEHEWLPGLGGYVDDEPTDEDLEGDDE